MAGIENDMDELFRKAADNYKLKDAENDWDKIANSLSAGSFNNDAERVNKDRKKFFWLILLLLLFLPTCTYLFYQVIMKGKTVSTSPAINKGKSKINKENISSTDKSEEQEYIAPRTSGKEFNQNRPKQNLGFTQNGSTREPNVPASKPPQYVTREKNKTIAQEKLISQVPGRSIAARVREGAEEKNLNKEGNRVLGDNNPKISTTVGRNGNSKPGESLKKIETPSMAHIPKSKAKDISMVTADSSTSNFNNIPKEIKDDKSKVNVDTTLVAALPGKTKAGTVQRGNGILFGIVTGPEWNQVKGQGVTKAGFDFGVMTGYRFNKKSSLEVGILFAKKFYYSSGAYFNLKMPGKDVKSLEGSSTIIEVPIKFKYDFLTTKNSSLFASAGAISYFLTNETNDYILLVNGAEMNMTSSYTEGSRYFAAALNVSIGYERYFNHSIALRIEPYAQIPLKGIGVGTMEVLSTGIHLGFTGLLRKGAFKRH
jgi:hypothetical protein